MLILLLSLSYLHAVSTKFSPCNQIDLVGKCSTCLDGDDKLPSLICKYTLIKNHNSMEFSKIIMIDVQMIENQYITNVNASSVYFENAHYLGTESSVPQIDIATELATFSDVSPEIIEKILDKDANFAKLKSITITNFKPEQPWSYQYDFARYTNLEMLSLVYETNPFGIMHSIILSSNCFRDNNNIRLIKIQTPYELKFEHNCLSFNNSLDVQVDLSGNQIVSHQIELANPWNEIGKINVNLVNNSINSLPKAVFSKYCHRDVKINFEGNAIFCICKYISWVIENDSCASSFLNIRCTDGQGINETCPITPSTSPSTSTTTPTTTTTTIEQSSITTLPTTESSTEWPSTPSTLSTPSTNIPSTTTTTTVEPPASATDPTPASSSSEGTTPASSSSAGITSSTIEPTSDYDDYKVAWWIILISVLIPILIIIFIFTAVIYLHKKRYTDKIFAMLRPMRVELDARSMESDSINSINEEVESSVILSMDEIDETSDLNDEEADNQDQTNVYHEFIEEAASTETNRIILDENDIEVITKIGNGHFGEVHLAVMRDDDGHFTKEVVVKTLQKDRFVNKNELQKATKEAIIMREFDHDNVLTLIGVYFKNTEPVIVMPLMRNGNLLAYIKNYQVNLKTLLQFANDVAKGMRYLASKSMIHRDLAARNCLLDAELRVKVSDFGLTKHMISKTYYRCQTRTQLPINWMAIESLRDRVFTAKTDVWSYGVLVWELMSGGQQPYDNRFSWEGLLLHLLSGQRLPKPDACPQPVYHLCMECWEEDTEQRPDFDDIIRSLIETTNAPVVDRRVEHGESNNYVNWSL